MRLPQTAAVPCPFDPRTRSPSTVADGATSKPAMTTLANGTVLLAYNQIQRKRMVVRTSEDGATWGAAQTIDDGAGLSSDC